MSPNSSLQLTATDPETLAALATLTIKVRRVIEGLQGGAHPSLHFGASVEFAEHKRYSPGDDVRNIDWNAYARTDRYFVKQHQKEVVLSSLLLLDCSASMGYQGSRSPTSKISFASELLATLAYVLIHQGDAAGLLTFSSQPDLFIPPGKRPDQLALLMRHFAFVKAKEKSVTNYSDAIGRAAGHAGKRALIVLASDLWGAGRETELALARLSARGHDIALFHVLDPDELDLPFNFPTALRDMEGDKTVDVDPTQIREDYRQEVKRTIDRWRRFSGENGIDYVHAPTSLSGVSVLSEFAGRRQKLHRRIQ
jgi:uncharacterized protein (DUF58 family)